jgi:glycopeptide antibiotics resistance protein
LKNKHYIKRLSIGAFTIYIIALLKITVFRSGISLDNLFINGTVIAKPFTSYIEMILDNKWYQFIYLFVGNIIWFVPFGVLLPLITKIKISFFRMGLYGLMLSLTIEVSQFIFGTGISEIDDLILNTLGAIVGYTVYKIIIHFYLLRKSLAS